MRLLALSMLIIASVPGAASADMSIRPPVPLTAYDRKEFSPDLGAPSSALMMAQSSDGILWFSTVEGLFRSDGVGFDRLDIPGFRSSNAMAGLAMTPDGGGGMWMAVRGGGLTHIQGASLRNYDEKDGLPAGKSVIKILQVDRQLLAATQAGLFEYRAGSWVQSSPVPELRDKPLHDAEIDARGNLWLLSDAGAHYGDLKKNAFVHVAIPMGDDPAPGLIAAADGSMWLYRYAGATRNLCRIFPVVRSACWDIPRLEFPLFDPDGSLWWLEQGTLFRAENVLELSGEDPTEILRQSQSLEMPSQGLARARDGSIWVLSSEGITRLRAPAYAPTRTPSGGLAIAGTAQVWLISFSRGLMRVGKPAGTEAFYTADDGSLWTGDALRESGREGFNTLQDSAPPDEPVVLERYQVAVRGGFRVATTPDGDIYVNRLAPPAVTRMSKGKLEEVPVPTLDAGAAIRSVREDRTGALWISVSSNRVPLYRQVNGTWAPVNLSASPPLRDAGPMAFDDDGVLWVTSRKDGLFAVKDNRVQQFGSAQGTQLGRAIDVFPQQGHVWATGSEGLFFRAGSKFLPLTGVNNVPFIGVTGLTQMPNGDLWFAGTGGIFRVKAAEWREAARNPNHQVRFLNLDRLDGVRSQAARGPFPSVTATPDGNLWFAMQSGLFHIDPRKLPDHDPAPPVLITQVLVDGAARATQNLELLPGGQHLVVRFLAPGVRQPERTNFRYRLLKNGREGEWSLAGKERRIAFERLPHGEYQLELAASDREGYWSGKTTLLPFTVRPSFHETWSFYALIALIAILSGGILYVTRTRRLAARIRHEMEARLSERERIARDLHDTLLQGMQGLLLSFQGIASKLPSEDPLRQKMSRALDQTQDVLREGRDRVHLLREPIVGTLVDDLHRLLADLASQRGVLCDLDVPNVAREIKSSTRDELTLIGREAIRNAFAHAQASRISVVVDFGDHGLLLCVVDDGVGIAPGADGLDGHWGLRGMRERARLAGADLTVSRRSQGGTEVKVFVPADKAYAAGKGENI